MPKTITYEFVKESFEKEGYKLLSTSYKGAHKKLYYICPKGHRHNISWNNFRRGQRCAYCAGQKVNRTIESITQDFKKEGYILLTKNYINNKQRLEYICSKGHKHFMRLDHWRRGIRCPYCAGKAKLSIEFIRSKFAKEGYKLLTEVYKNVKQKLDYVCPKGHKHSIIYSDWRIGHRCPYCAGCFKKNILFVKKEFEQEGYKLLTKKYKNAFQKLKYVCPSGHKHSTSWAKWSMGRRCPTCAIVNNSGKNHYNWQGGIACEPYCSIWLDKEFKEGIRSRDNHQCQNPDCWGTSKKLCGHHIDYNKKNCRRDNIITVCNSCNGRANIDRGYWMKFYQEIMVKKYGYSYR
jgi:DNA-directed RNA polymerase subunit RPC12/RpoP